MSKATNLGPNSHCPQNPNPNHAPSMSPTPPDVKDKLGVHFLPKSSFPLVTRAICGDTIAAHHMPQWDGREPQEPIDKSFRGNVAPEDGEYGDALSTRASWASSSSDYEDARSSMSDGAPLIFGIMFDASSCR